MEQRRQRLSMDYSVDAPLVYLATPPVGSVVLVARAAAHLAFDRMRSDPDARDFAHPIWWAAFTMTGA